ncbi:MAG: ABC transporter ATP-binding protein [Eubacterium sp.]|nr:ABC transporter ATP-binding protein [Eubacterium sp.]MBQ8952445.1 ABC transporter ATP-binding protein [Eubacterium sp.]
MLYVNNLFKQYGNFWAVTNLNLHVPKGDLFGFVGPNGAGKTTTIRIICGLLKATSGEVVVNGESGSAGIKNLKRTIGYVPDFFGVYDNLKVKEYLEFYGSLYGMTYKETENVANGLLDLVNLADKKEVYVDTLSRGMKQRLCVARALLHNPELLVMDEPSSGLDPGARVEMKELLMNLQSMGKTIVISSHILADISEMCNSIGIMNHGQLVAAGLMKDILNIGNDASRLIIEVKSDIEQAVTIMREQPNVQIEAVKSNEIIVTGITSDEMANSLVGQLMVRGVLVGGFHRDEHSLESIFMDITEGRAGGVQTMANQGSNNFGAPNNFGGPNNYETPSNFGSQNNFGAPNNFGAQNNFEAQNNFGTPNNYETQNNFGASNSFEAQNNFGAQNNYAAPDNMGYQQNGGDMNGQN